MVGDFPQLGLERAMLIPFACKIALKLKLPSPKRIVANGKRDSFFDRAFVCPDHIIRLEPATRYDHCIEVPGKLHLF